MKTAVLRLQEWLVMQMASKEADESAKKWLELVRDSIAEAKSLGAENKKLPKGFNGLPCTFVVVSRRSRARCALGVMDTGLWR